ncbi:LOW QUALITY PROTEIN: hypothetical protein SORBI_3004G331800 [Sorghum bicolor]|uniref:Uncharacterized protein n=1 Tax=Sorghum bicolor TaxID=4558 RepID=A0A1Z5RQP7_SORBI|nr:LOW QUALITY PROTEIN: hypothetical protein SORBI_3004G331800 [Sorghum bicolor]
MATAVLRSHDALNNRMHLDAYTPSPAKPRRRRSPKPAAASSPPARAAAPIASTKPAAKAVTPAKAPVAPGRRSPPARPAASSRKQPSPTKEKSKQRLVMEEVRILKRGEEPPAPAPAPVLAVPPVALAAAVDQRVLCSTGRIGPQAPAVVPTKRMVSAPAASSAAVYAGPAFSAAAPEPSSLPMPAFFLRRAESEATRGLRCLLRIGELA